MTSDSLFLPLRILYAEDEQEMRESVATILKRRVKNVVPVSNGKEAFDRFVDGDTDMLITDLQMPVMGGAELARKVREIAPGFPVIVMSAFNDDTHAISGADATVFKPVLKNDLIAAVVKCAQKLKDAGQI